MTPSTTLFLPILPEFPKLSYPMDALSPYLSGETLCFILQGILPEYYQKFNDLKKHLLSQHPDDYPAKTLSLSDYLSQHITAAPLSRYATEIYHHAFWFASLKKDGGGLPHSDFLAKILRDFGSFEKFQAEFVKHATDAHSLDAHWLWLVSDSQDKLSVTTSSHTSPLAHNVKPLIACNLWQHAYYLDYRERKGDYVQTFLTKLINWQHAESTFYDPNAWQWD